MILQIEDLHTPKELISNETIFQCSTPNLSEFSPLQALGTGGGRKKIADLFRDKFSQPCTVNLCYKARVFGGRKRAL